MREDATAGREKLRQEAERSKCEAESLKQQLAREKEERKNEVENMKEKLIKSQKQTSYQKKKRAEMKQKNADLALENSVLAKRPDIEILNPKDNKGRFTFEAARRIIKHRVAYTLSLKKTCQNAIDGLNLIFQDPTTVVDGIELPKQTTVARMQIAIAKISTGVLKGMLEDIKHCALMFDGSTQFKFCNMLAVSLNVNLGEDVKPILLDVVNTNSQQAGNEANKIEDILEYYAVNLAETVAWMCGDCCNGNLGPKGGVAVRLSQKAGRFICFIKCAMHVLQFSFWNAMEDILGTFFLDDLSSVVKWYNQNRYKNQELLKELCEIRKVTLAANPCKTRICSYFAACKHVVEYWDEMKTLAETMINETQGKVAKRWETALEFFNDEESRFLASFLLDFHKQIFLPFLSFFENAESIQDKAKVGEKLIEFKTKVDRIEAELVSMTGDEYNWFRPAVGDVMEHTWDALPWLEAFVESEDRFHELVEDCSLTIWQFGKRFFKEMEFYSEFPYIGVQLFSDKEATKKRAAAHILSKIAISHSEQDLEYYYKLFDNPEGKAILEEMKETGASERFEGSDFEENLTSLYECMSFTNVYSERVFSIQNNVQRLKRNIGLGPLRQYIFLCVNKLDISGDHQQEFEAERAKIRKREAGELEHEEVCDVFGECFLERFQDVDRDYERTARRLMQSDTLDPTLEQ